MRFTVQQKVQCCYWLTEFKFPVTEERKFRQEYGQDPPERHSIVAQHKQLLETGSVLRRKGSGNLTVAPDSVEAIQEAFQRCPLRCIRRASR
jgi:ferredoxin